MNPLKSSNDQTGFTLIELMIAITIGMLITAGLTSLFASTSQARGEIERANRQIENGRYAMHLLTEDLRLAGFFGEFSPTVLTAPATVPNPCLTTLADLRSTMPLHVQGYDDTDAALTCLSDVRANTDVLVIRRVSTCVAGTGDCDSVSSGIPYFQASRCASSSELGSATVTNWYALDTDTANLIKMNRDCTTQANLRRYRTHIYFIANNGISSDGIPTLKRAELGAASFSIVALAEGIENMQIEYGIDTDNDGSPNAYTTDPGSYNACAGAACVTNWQNVVSTNVNLLARNTENSAGYTDSKTYTLGVKADGTANTVGPFNDRVRRHAYQTVVRLHNPAGRRE